MKKGIDNSGKMRYNIFVRFDKYGRMAQLVEHIVHIDGVTGSSPVATTTRLAGRNVCQVFSYPTAMLERM